MIDQFYTPPELASVLVGCLPKSFQPKVVADFAAGEGSLLTAAQSRWPPAGFLRRFALAQATRLDLTNQPRPLSAHQPHPSGLRPDLPNTTERLI